MEVQPESWGDYLPSNRTIQFLIFPLCAQKNLKIKYCTMTYCSSICSKKKKNALRARGSPNFKKKNCIIEHQAAEISNQPFPLYTRNPQEMETACCCYMDPL